MSIPVRRDRLGVGAILWTWDGEISESLSARVLQVYRRWKNDPVLTASGLLDVVPAYTSVAIHFDPVFGKAEQIIAHAESLLRETETAAPERQRDQQQDHETVEPARKVEIPVCYNGSDLSRVATRCGITAADVIRRHTAARYTVAMIGFRPHFPYLIGMDPSLAVPRLDEPRTAVPAGSVGIAGIQTGVYPVTSPGGWNIIGTCDPQLLTTLQPGDRLIFRSASCG